MNKEEYIDKYTFWVVVVLFFLLICLIIILIGIGFNPKDKGEYDYCVEWDFWINRDNMIYNCYNLATQTFLCDYKILKDGRLEIKPISNITKNNKGEITQIIYDEPTYYNCTRWLKSKR